MYRKLILIDLLLDSDPEQVRNSKVPTLLAAFLFWVSDLESEAAK